MSHALNHPTNIGVILHEGGLLIILQVKTGYFFKSNLNHVHNFVSCPRQTIVKSKQWICVYMYNVVFAILKSWKSTNCATVHYNSANCLFSGHKPPFAPSRNGILILCGMQTVFILVICLFILSRLRPNHLTTVALINIILVTPPPSEGKFPPTYTWRQFASFPLPNVVGPVQIDPYWRLTDV